MPRITLRVGVRRAIEQRKARRLNLAFLTAFLDSPAAFLLPALIIDRVRYSHYLSWTSPSTDRRARGGPPPFAPPIRLPYLPYLSPYLAWRESTPLRFSSPILGQRVRQRGPGEHLVRPRLAPDLLRLALCQLQAARVRVEVLGRLQPPPRRRHPPPARRLAIDAHNIKFGRLVGKGEIVHWVEDGDGAWTGSHLAPRFYDVDRSDRVYE